LADGHKDLLYVNPGHFPGSDSPFLQTDEMIILAVVNQGHQDQTSIRIIPILVIQALDGGISSTNAIVILHPPSSSLTYTSPSNMTIVSNDPSLFAVSQFQSSVELHFRSVESKSGIVSDVSLCL